MAIASMLWIFKVVDRDRWAVDGNGEKTYRSPSTVHRPRSSSQDDDGAEGERARDAGGEYQLVVGTPSASAPHLGDQRAARRVLAGAGNAPERLRHSGLGRELHRRVQGVERLGQPERG